MALPMDSTTAWALPKNVAPVGHYSNATQVAADPIGNRIFAVWYDYSQKDNGISYAISTDEAATFSTATTLKRDNSSGNTDYVDLPTVAVDPSGAVYVAWLGYDADPSGMSIAKMNVFVARSPTDATTLDPVGKATPNSEFEMDGGLGGPFLSASPKDGALAVTWTQVKTGSTERNIRLSLSKDQGATWSKPVTLSETTERPMAVRGRARSAFSADGQLSVIWIEYTDQQFGSTANAVYLQQVDTDGKLTGGNVKISGETDSPGYDVPSLAVWGSTIAVAFASGDDSGAWDIHLVHSIDGGASFQPSVKLNDDPTCATHFRPSIGFDAAGLLHAIFYDNRYLSGNVFYATAALGGLAGPVVSANQRVSATGFRFSTSGQGFSVLSDYLGLAITPTGIFASYTAPAPMSPPVPLLTKLSPTP